MLPMPFNEDVNILVGDNESGKSTILQAIDLVIRASSSKIEELGIDKLMNNEAIDEFLSGERKFENLPEIVVELYLSEDPEEITGTNNSYEEYCSGISLSCRADERFSRQIKEYFLEGNEGIPFEYYEIAFETFAGSPYTRRSNYLKGLFVENSNVGNSYSLNEYIRNIFDVTLERDKQIELKQKYRTHKDVFVSSVMNDYQLLEDGYTFSLKNSVRNGIESDLSISDRGVALENKGTGLQCFIKTDLALSKKENIDVILLEEPENHLSYTNTLKLIEKIKTATNQLFVTTHSDLICTRLDLRKCFLLNSSSCSFTSLKFIPEETADFFIKAPDNKMLQFCLSAKTLLVEGDAEYILMEKMFNKTLGKPLKDSNIGIISVDGLCFKRYLDIAKIIGMRVAIVTDNDKDYQVKIDEKYAEYKNDNVGVFADADNSRYTFEVCLYQDNKQLCDKLFSEGRRTLTVQDYMLNNKADVAFALADSMEDIEAPGYIKDALIWIDA